MTDQPKPGGRPTRIAAVVMLIIIVIVVIAFVGMNLHDVTKATQ